MGKPVSKVTVVWSPMDNILNRTKLGTDGWVPEVVRVGCSAREPPVEMEQLCIPSQRCFQACV